MAVKSRGVGSVLEALMALLRMTWYALTMACTLSRVSTVARVMASLAKAVLIMAKLGWLAPSMPVTPRLV